MRHIHRLILIVFGFVAIGTIAFLVIGVDQRAVDAVRAHIGAIGSSDWGALIELAPPAEIAENGLNEVRLQEMFEEATKGFDIVGFSQCAVTDPVEEVEGRAFFVLEPIVFNGRKLLIESAKNADGVWKVPIYQSLYQVCRASAGSLPGSLDRLADSMEAVGIDRFYIWQRNATVHVSDLRLAARSELDVAQLEKPRN